MEARIAKRRLLASLLWMAPGLVFSGYVAVRRAGMAVLYKPVSLEDWQIHPDVCYRDGSADEKHRLDLFLPRGANWPVLIFIHGGGLNSGDKALRVSGADVYGNIGRFYASQGIGVAVINYRLQPNVTWREQAEDVAHATAWVHSHMGIHGGDAGRLFIGGHSAGAHLATRVAADPRYLQKVGLSPSVFSGVIAVSGAGLDLCDTRTYELGAKLHHYEMRFRCGDPTDNWKREASPMTCIGPGAGTPPFLIMYAERESQALQRQSQLLHETLQRHEIPSELVVVPGQSHCRIVLTLSRPDKTSGPAILRFIEQNRACIRQV
jgi:acetyl esterase/lipase